MTAASRRTSLRAVLLDAGNTLVFVDRIRVFEIYREVGVEGDAARFDAAELTARAHLSLRVEEGQAGTEAHVWREYFETLFRLSGVPDAAIEHVGRRLKEEHDREHIWSHVEARTAEALDKLREAGFRLGVISNADGRVEAVLDRVGLRNRFEFVLDSHVVGVEKPDRRIFLEGARLLELPPEACLYVGDLYPVDVVGARGAGMDAVLLDPSGRIERPVDRLGAVGDLPDYLLSRRRGTKAHDRG
jgi:putative hydrolase of the HAD superfamily